MGWRQAFELAERPPKLDARWDHEPELAFGAALGIDSDCGLPLRQFYWEREFPEKKFVH